MFIANQERDQKEMEENWVIELEGKLNLMDPREIETRYWARCSIYRVPSYISHDNIKAYQPQMVSFGPYYHHDPRLHVMAEHKLRALYYFTSINPSRSVRDYAAALRGVVPQLMACYDQLSEEWRDEERFLKLMVTDGCFLLHTLNSRCRPIPESFPGRVPSKDPTFGPHGMAYNFPAIRRDMLLMENQIPFLVLHKLLAIQTGREEDERLEMEIVSLVVKACNPKMAITDRIQGLHILDVFRKSLIQGTAQVPPPPRPYCPRQPSMVRFTSWHSRTKSYFNCCFPKVVSMVRYLSQGKVVSVPDTCQPYEIPNVRSATALDEAGIVITASKTGSSTRDINFYNGVLTLPHISVDDATEYVFLNLMAYERMHESQNQRSEVTSFVYFMGKFVDSAKDVGLLRDKGIISNALGSDEEVVQLFSKTLSKDVPLDPECTLQPIYMELSAYCSRAWPRWVAHLRHNHFYKPWAFFSLCAALLLLAMGATQTIYSVLTFYLAKHGPGAS